MAAFGEARTRVGVAMIFYGFLILVALALIWWLWRSPVMRQALRRGPRGVPPGDKNAALNEAQMRHPSDFGTQGGKRESDFLRRQPKERD
jgi:hypothetical protein